MERPFPNDNKEPPIAANAKSAPNMAVEISPIPANSTP